MSAGTTSWVIPVITAAVGSIVTGLVGLLVWLLNRPKFNAEVDKLEAETEDLTSARLIRELDRLSSANTLQGVQLDQLRRDVIEYAKREHRHVVEIDSLKLQIAELQRNCVRPPTQIAGMNLADIFPVDIPHEPSEFDDPPRTDP